MKIGVCITTTPDRNHIFKHTYKQWLKYLPENAVLDFVIDFDKKGVSYAKNASLALLESKGITEYFISDDDVYPIHEDWHVPYVNHPEPHLMLQFDLPNNKLTELYRDETTVAYNKTRGCLIYVNQIVLDTVGGMDTRYVNSFEHPDWTTRIHNAGLTTHRAMDVPNSKELFYCHDQDNAIETSIKKNSIQNMKNASLYRQNRASKEYVEYR